VNRTDKEKTVAVLNEKFRDTQFAGLADFKGLDVAQISTLRHELRAAGTEFRVVKNSIAKRAIQGTSMEILDEHFIGSTAVALSKEDPVSPAKILTQFAKDNPKLQLKIGLLEGKVLSVEDLTDLSTLPSREVLLATLLGLLNAQPTGLVNVFAGMLRKLLGTLHAIEQEKTKTSDS
jgi:large subunit ribosomal protein L10